MTIHEKALQHFGAEKQKLKLIEEMSELIQAIIKDSNVAEEIADVQIVLDQIKLLNPQWISWQEIKIKRLQERINL